jgi:hypothetical protein
LLKQLEYNTVEGLSVNLEQGFDIKPIKGKYTYSLIGTTVMGSAIHILIHGVILPSSRKRTIFSKIVI